MEKTHEDVWREETQVIEILKKKMKKMNGTVMGASTLFKAGSVDPLQLVQLRQAHQTRRATKSVRPGTGGHDEAGEPTAGSERRKICMQMADVIRRTGTGLERGLRWKSGGAPGTRNPKEVALLSGNSANAELAASERVKTVRF